MEKNSIKKFNKFKNPEKLADNKKKDSSMQGRVMRKKGYHKL